jgi:L-alanine-DL-glutamate epimerase-like enolase superfamily enzyme
MKVGRDRSRDLHRVHVAREAIGSGTELFVDANGAYDRKEALYCMELFAGECDVRWMEEPLPAADVAGRRFLRQRAPSRMEIADGEYGYDLSFFRSLLEAEVVDVVMADATRCGGISGFLKIGTLCEVYGLPLSSHCAPLLHLHAACALPSLRHMEYFHDHVRIENLFFDNIPQPVNGELRPDLSRPGLGVEFKDSEAERYRKPF